MLAISLKIDIKVAPATARRSFRKNGDPPPHRPVDGGRVLQAVPADEFLQPLQRSIDAMPRRK
ncbi:hypothetical protein C9I57_20160 [Trinickia symbiotica]|uniref:Uncharacterized protein n=1 Tax=Trinickia symbiotica TaxID=863227 RepID=A0A2N7X574_9BURK|nr:hypothetical protein C0Z20_11845 [Trinickia symbiotica]PTB18816.1 hypothetical protein C9I57_20160 [Trinickia symbiotica]